MMKRVISMLLAILMVLSLIGCGSSADSTEAKKGFYKVCDVYYPEELGAPVLGEAVADLELSSAVEQITNVGDAIYYLQTSDAHNGLFIELIADDYEEIGEIHLSRADSPNHDYAVIYIKSAGHYYPFDFDQLSYIHKSKKDYISDSDLEALCKKLGAAFPRPAGVKMNFLAEVLYQNVSESIPNNTERVPEGNNDIFLVEDDIVDSVNDVVISFDTFLAERNEAHKSATETGFSEEFIARCTPDFHDTLNLVSKEEAEALLNTEMNFDMNATCTKEEALEDVDLLFRLFAAFFGSYHYYGGSEVFDAAEAKIVEEIQSYNKDLTLGKLSQIIMENLIFIKDRHMNVGNWLICEYNNIAVADYYVKDLFFYEDDVGYYTKKHDKKWYLEAVGDDSNVSDYFKITIDEKGQLCYMLGLSVTATDKRLNIAEITLVRGTNVVEAPILWRSFVRRAWETINETINIREGIPFLEIDFKEEGPNASDDYDAQQERVRQMGRDVLTQDVLVMDANSGCGWQSLFESISHRATSLWLYKLSYAAEYLGRWNMPWNRGTYGEYVVNHFEGCWGENDTLIFAVQDASNYSASEDSIAELRSIENVITVGGNTGGTAGPGSSTNQHMTLPQTGLFVQFGASLSVDGYYSEDGYCIDPDIWVNPTEAVDAIYRLCDFYGIKNTADTSILDKYS